MKLKRDTKFGEESTCCFKIDIRNLTNLTWALKILKDFHFNRLFLSKAYIFWAKKVQRSFLSWNWRGIQNLERKQLVISKLTLGIWDILTWALESFKLFQFNGLLLSKVYIVQAKKVQRSYLSWNWRVIKKFGEETFVVWKLRQVIS